MRRSKSIWLGKSERRGMLAVGVAILGLWAIHFSPNPKLGLQPQEAKENSVAHRMKYPSQDRKENTRFLPKNWNHSTLHPFQFNPNTISADSLTLMGLPKTMVEKWIKARSRGFVFRKPADLQRFSILTPSIRAKLSPFVDLPSAVPTQRQKWQAPPRPKVMVELNDADSLELLGLPGIGPALSKRIILYRDRLGGFHRHQQLLEIYGIDSQILAQILPQISINPQTIQSRSWNTISLEELKLFPYLSNKEAQIIVQYRKVHGPFANLEAVKKIKGIRPDIPEKLTPYLLFEL